MRLWHGHRVPLGPPRRSVAIALLLLAGSASRAHGAFASSLTHARLVVLAPSIAASGIRLSQGAAFLPVAPAAQSANSDGSTPSIHPSFGWRLDAALAGTGFASLLIARSLTADTRLAPPNGLLRSDIRFGFDERTIGHTDADAGRLSDRTRDLALAFPILLRAASERGGEHVRSPFRIALVYIEAMSIAEGTTSLVRKVVSRPRPFTYLPETERPLLAEYDARADRAFQSFPSGHSTAAWCAASLGICDHLLSRPSASCKEHVMVGFIGGVLAAATSSLRVEAGQHFPSDVVSGAAIGIASGTALPLLHRYASRDDHRAPMPPRRSWVGAFTGMATGAAVGLFAAEVVSE